MSVITRDIPLTTRAATTRQARDNVSSSAAIVSNQMQQWRGTQALREADRIARVARQDVTPEMEPDSPSLTTEEPGEDFTDNEDVTDDMEPFDPSIESALVEGDESQVTITAEEGETIVAVIGDDEHIEVDIEDTADVLLGIDAA